jgi:hypothetical protein
MNLSEAQLTFRQVKLGAPDAEADRKLGEYFLETPYVASALELNRSLYLGRKGSGKSALFTQLPRLMRESGYDHTKVISITPDQYAWNALQSYTESGILPEKAHANAWKFTIAIEIASILSAMPDSFLTSTAAQEELSRVKSFAQENFGQSKPRMMATAGKLLKGIKSFNITAFGFGAGLERDLPEALTPYIIDALFDTLSIISQEVGVVVCLDKLDDSWDGSEQSMHLLIGLLKASKEINDKLKGEDPRSGIFIIVFLRSDIYMKVFSLTTRISIARPRRL